MPCPSCGSVVPADARFCPSCGTALAARPDERRVVTVLFADLVGFTTFSETADPETVKDVVDTAFVRLVADVEAFGGGVDKIVGDAVLALFGAPVAHEDDPERAVRAALRMQETVARLRAGRIPGAQLRIGVNTGEVLVGALRAGGDSTVMGDVVNIASRLQTSARPGEVLVGPATYHATRHAVRYEPRGPLPVRGRGEPVEAWAAVEVVARPGQRPAREPAPLVGREAETAVLRAVLDDAVRRRRAHLVTLVGDAGVGKSRLARELAGVARDAHDAEVLGGRCLPYGEANPWWPVAEAVRRWLGLDAAAGTDDLRAALRARLPEVLGRLPEDAETVRVADGLLLVLGRGAHLDADPARAREDALRSVQAWLEALARARPLVLALVDVHWAEAPVRDLVDRLLPRLRALPFVLVATARTDVEEQWTPAPGRHDLVVLNVEPLDARATDALVTHLLGADATPPLVALLRDRSGGNPFFVEELVALVRETGRGGGAGLPVTLRGLVAARLDALPPPERGVLEDAAVVGPSGAVHTVLALAASRGEPAPADALGALVARDLLERTDGEYAFRSELVRDVAYGTLTKAERARRHAAVAALLEEGGGGPDGVEGWAHHWAVAAELVAELGPVAGSPPDVRERAVDALGRAAEQATRAERWADGRRFLERALALLPGDADPSVRRWIRIGLLHVAAELREVAAARAGAEEVLAEAEAAGDERAAVRALTVLGAVQQRTGDLGSSVASYEAAIERARRCGDAELEAVALRGRGMTWLLTGALDRAEATIGEALAAFTALGDRRGTGWALENLAWISFSRGDSADAEERVRASVETFKAGGDWGGLQVAHGLLGWIRFAQDRFDEASALGEELAADAEQAGNLWVLATARTLLANLAVWQGRAGAAVDLARAARTAFAELGEPWGLMQTYLPEARARACQGRLAEAYALLAEWEAAGRGVERRTSRGLPAVVASGVAAQAGDAGRALAEAERAVAEAAPGQTLGGTERDVALGVALLLAGRVGAARRHLERRRGQATGSAHRAPVEAHLALALAAEGDVAGAVALAAPRAGNAALPYLDRVHAGVALAAALARRGDAGPAVAAADGAVEAADASESVLDQAVARLCRAVVLEAVGGDAAGARREAQARLADVGVDAAGWERVVRRAAVGDVRDPVTG